jgi:predicted nucleic acid-binding protein
VERVVLDPGVLVSALITPRGNPAKLWQAVVDQRLEIAVCPRLLAELAGVLERSKFRSYVTPEEARAFVARSPGGPTGRPTQTTCHRSAATPTTTTCSPSPASLTPRPSSAVTSI